MRQYKAQVFRLILFNFISIIKEEEEKLLELHQYVILHALIANYL